MNRYDRGNWHTRREGYKKDTSKDRETPKDILINKILPEITKEKPDWESLMKDRGHVDKLTSNKDFRKDMKTTQLRKFFDEVKRIERLLREGKDWNSIEPDLWKLTYIARYAASRKHIPKEFSIFISKAVENIITKSNDKKAAFYNFERIFESIVAYHKYHGGD